MLKPESVHRQHLGLDAQFMNTSDSVKRDLSNVMNSGNFHVTPQICREMNHVGSGIDHIRLDHDFLRSSREWGNKWDPSVVNRSKQGAIQSMNTAQGTLNQAKSGTNTQRTQTLQENQLRDTHHKTVNGLLHTEREMAPYAHESIDRVKQFCDHIGVTDRYTGYRNNLNRGSRDPVNLAHSWMDGTTSNTYNNTLNVSWRPGNAVPTKYTKQDSRLSVSAPVMRQGNVTSEACRPHTTRSIQEQCGINMTFPGRTEYMKRYIRPPTNQRTPSYIVNPIPDYTVHGRPLGHAAIYRKATEYQTRYEWPDGAKIEKLPWVRV